jgi:hypothetical protein
MIIKVVHIRWWIFISIEQTSNRNHYKVLVFFGAAANNKYSNHSCYSWYWSRYLTYTILAPASATGNTTGAANGIFTGLPSGNYTFRVTDGNNCYDTESHFVAPVTPIVATATKLTDVDCRGNTQVLFVIT